MSFIYDVGQREKTELSRSSLSERFHQPVGSEAEITPDEYISRIRHGMGDDQYERYTWHD